MMYSMSSIKPKAKPKASDCLLIGDSLTNYYYTNWNNLYTGSWQIDAYGVPGGQIDYLIARILDGTVDITNYKSIFFLLGINNLAAGDTIASTLKEMDQIIDLVKTRETHVISVLPLNNNIKPFPTNALAMQLNWGLRGRGNFINCYDALATASGGMNAHVYTDGIHLLQSAYDIIEPIIYSHIDFT